MNTIDQTEIDDHISTALVAREETAVSEALPPEQIKAPVTAAQLRVEQVGELLAHAYEKASTLDMTDKEVDELTAPFPDDIVEIRPHDGLIYIPHIHISARLHKVFRPGKVAMVKRQISVRDNRIYGEWVMLIRGCFVGESIGAMDYHPNNPKMNYADAAEGTRGECIRRIAGKELSCGNQVWNPEYSRQWVTKYAEQRNGKWFKKNQQQATSLTQPEPILQPKTEPAKPVPNPRTVDEALDKQIEGTLEVVVAKPTAKGNTRWGIKVVYGADKDADAIWIGTFDRKLGENLDVLKGNRVIANYRENGRFNDLVSIGPA